MTIDTLICVHSQDTDHDAMLQDAIMSVLEGSLKPNNLVVVYDACWGYTRDYIENWLAHRDIGSVKYIPVAKTVKQGLAVAKNFGLKFCTSDWITYCDADDKWINSKLEIQKDYLVKHPELTFISTECWDSYGGLLKPSYYKCGVYETHESIKTCLARGENPLVHGSMFINKSAIESLGGYQDVRGREDMDLWIRAINAGFRFAKIPERLYCYGMGTSVSR